MKLGSRSVSLCLFVLLGFGSTSNSSTLPTLTQPIVVSEWKVVGPFLTGPRDVDLDFLSAYGGEAHIVPSDEQVFFSPQPDSGVVRWFPVEASGPNVKVDYPRVDWAALTDAYGQAGMLAIGYAYAEIHVPRAVRALASVRRVQSFYVNGGVFEGEPYSSRFTRVPITLRQGKNRILLKFVSWGVARFYFQLEPARSEVVVLDDYTLPDLAVGQRPGRLLAALTLANTTRHWLRGLRLVVEPDSEGPFVRTVSPIPPVAPLSVLKVPFALELRRVVNDSDGTRLRLTVRVLRRDEQLSTASIGLDVKSPDDVRRVTFVSAIDSSVQYYAVRYPRSYDPGRTYSLVLSLHGAGVRAEGQCAAHGQKDWAFVVAPTNRRPFGFDWQDWGRLDLFEVLGLALQRYPIDPNRVYLVGHSMGGQGTWYNGLHHPDVFAAIAPSAGWTSFQLYTPFFLQRSEVFAPPGILRFRHRILLDCNSPFFAVNAMNLPTVVTQGGADDNVPPFHARFYQEIFKRLGYEFVYREVPGKPHWWSEPQSEGRGADCVDNPEIFTFLRSKVRNPAPKQVVFRTVDLSNADGAYWVKVLEQFRSFAETWVEARVQGERVKLRTSNVRALSLHLPHLLIPGDQAVVDWNGRTFEVNLVGDRAVTLTLEEHSAIRAGALRKSPRLYGPVKAAFFQPFLIVYGTSGTEEETSALLNSARRIAAQFWRRANGFARIVPDVEVTDRMMSEHNLILLGGPSRNALAAELTASWPVRIEGERIMIDEETLDCPDLGLIAVYPNPRHPDRLVALLAGTSLRAEKCVLAFRLIRSGSGVPDFVVFTPRVRTEGWGGVVAAGFFSPRWDLSNRDFSVRLCH